MQVRVENLYYLLCYAWNQLDARSLVPVGEVDGQSPERLFARVFITAAEQLLQQRLDRSYLEQREDARRPRGKLSVSTTVARGLLQRGLVDCQHDDLTDDVLHNRLIKATARVLAQLDTVAREQHGRLLAIVRSMPGVSDVRVTASAFRRLQLHSNLRRYRFILHLCELVHRCTLIDAKTGRLTFHSFAGSPQEMGALFQAFLLSFLRVEQTAFLHVDAKQVPWALEGDDAGLLPTMQTDIVLRRPGTRVVLEAKCYGAPLVGKFGGAGALKSEDVYQLLSYVTNLQAASVGEAVLGALLYAVDEDRVPRARFSVLGQSLHVVPINLNRPWQHIHAAIQSFVAELATVKVAERVT